MSEEEVFVPQVMKENVEVTRWIHRRVSNNALFRRLFLVRGRIDVVLCRLRIEVTGARLASSRHARKRQRKIARRLRVRFEDEDQSVVGMLESPGADLERPGMLEDLVVALETASKRIWLARDGE